MTEDWLKKKVRDRLRIRGLGLEVALVLELGQGCGNIVNILIFVVDPLSLTLLMDDIGFAQEKI
jgi:hypothetical protein